MDLIILVIGVFLAIVALIFGLLILVDKKEKPSQKDSVELTLAKAKREFDVIVANQSASLEKSLQNNADKISKAFITSLEQVTQKQLSEFSAATQSLLKQTVADLQATAKENDAATKLAHNELNALTAQAKADAIKKVDTQIAEIMIGYMADIAGNIDYQQQKDYLFSSLEAHKDALKKDIEASVK